MANRKIPLNKEEILSLYFDQRKTFSEIASIYNCNSQTICNRFKEWGVKARTPSEALKGRPILWKEKIAKALKGKTLSKESKQKISLARKGLSSPFKGFRKVTHPEIVKWGCPKEKHWNWKGGISSKTNLLRQLSQYKHWRDMVFKRDDYTCQFCGKRGGYLEAHHIIPVATLLQTEELYDLIFAPEDGYTLCKKCHTELHKEVIRDRREDGQANYT
jgi:transposase-like protein